MMMMMMIKWFCLLWILSTLSLFYASAAVHENDVLFSEIDKLESGEAMITRRSESLSSTCRFANNIRLSPDIFALFACAACYKYIDARLFRSNSKLMARAISLFDPKTNESYIANWTSVPDSVWESFVSEKSRTLWIDCCESAVDCCDEIESTTSQNNDSFCPKTWDGWECWPDTPSGTTITKNCPWHIYFHSEPTECSGWATKTCTENGTWYVNEWNLEWTNFTTCGRSEDILRLLRAHVYSMSVSVIFLVPALSVFMSYSQLQVFRIRMHKNLFWSLLLNAVFVIAFERHFMNETLESNANSSVETNAVLCRIVFTLTKYFRLCTYMWMLCEGFYLHKLIVAAFTEQNSMMLYYTIGWGFPCIPVFIWGVLRHLYADSGCWTMSIGYYEWILNGPMLLAILINIYFLGNIIHILVLKLKSTHTKEPTQFRRAVKATAVLIPLFGLHFLLVMYHPSDGKCGFLHVYTIVTHCVDGLQGAVVSIIFCYLNNEVRCLLQRTYRRQRLIMSVGQRSTSQKSQFESRMSISTNASTLTESYSRKGSR